jgi:hypothetical protein
MSATDSFYSALGQLPAAQRHLLEPYIGQIRGEMFAARSEDARMRVLELFLRELHDRLRGSR